MLESHFVWVLRESRSCLSRSDIPLEERMVISRNFCNSKNRPPKPSFKKTNGMRAKQVFSRALFICLFLLALAPGGAVASLDHGPCLFSGPEYGGPIRVKGGNLGRGPYTCTTRGNSNSTRLTYTCQVRGGTASVVWIRSELNNITYTNGVLSGGCQRSSVPL